MKVAVDPRTRLDRWAALLAPVQWKTGRAGFKARCPAHADEDPSLDVDVRAGRFLWMCRAGCEQRDVAQAVTALGNGHGAQPDAVVTIARGDRPPVRSRRDPLGELAELCAVPRKHIDRMARRGWLAARGDAVAFLFGATGPLKARDLAKPKKEGIRWIGADDEAKAPPIWPLLVTYPETIWLTEGETDCVVLRSRGLDAFAITKGAGTGLTPAQIDALRGRGVRRVVVAFDADPAGRDGSSEQVASIAVAGLDVATTCPPAFDPLTGSGKDWRDWHRSGGTALPEPIDATPPPFFIGHGQALAIAAEDVRWVVPNLIAEGDKVMIAGPQKSLKTFLALDLTRALAAGGEFLGRPEWLVERPARVAFIEEEGSPSLFFRRVAKMGEVPDGSVAWAHRRGFKFTDDAAISTLIERLLAFDPAVAIFDPMQRMTPGIDENDASKTGVVWDAIQRIQLALPRMAVVVIHHANKQARLSWESIRGSSRHAGEVDLGVFVEKEGEDLLRVVIDGRDVPTATGYGDALLVHYSVTSDGFSLIDTGTRVRIRKTGGRTNRSSDQSKQLVLDAVKETPGATKKQIALALDIDEYTVGEYLRDLEREGAIHGNQPSVIKPKKYAAKEGE